MSENKKAKCIMVQGTMSGAGKSLLCAALCRIFAQDGLHTAPFKSQNMALNSFVTRDGLEMGRAQVVQAQAAGVEPDVRMNPILLKPSSDVGSQVIVNGEVRGQMKASQYFKMKKSLIPDILRAYNSLAEDFDVIVIEGAGSPAEINLKADDIVNMGLAKLVDAPVLLVGDIDRGGVFAQLFGTVELLETDERDRIKGLVINKFRGDVEILRPGLSMLEDKTHLPVLGVVPYLRVDIEDEDSLSERLEKKDAVRPLDIAVIRLPHISNFTDFMVLEQHPLMDVRYVQNTRELGAPDLVILPGTKNTVEDLLWLRQSGLEAVILKLAAKGLPEFERVGGYYMLGEELSEQGYHASYVYCDAQMMEITKAQMELLEGRVPEKANEVVVSEYFLSTYGNNAKIGDTVTLDTESFHGDYVVTGIMDSVNEKEANTCAIILSNAALTGWKGFDPTGYRAYVHFKNSDQLGEELMTSYCREIAEEYQLPMPKMNSKYFAYASKSFDFALMAGVIAIVLIGGYIVIQSIFRISINDKIKSYGQLRTIGATPKQIKRIVKREGRKLGSIGILIGTVLGVCGGFLLFSKGFNAVSYVATVILTLISSWIMVSVSIRKPVKIAAGISPIEAVRFTPAQKDIRSRKKNIKLNPVSMGIANFKRDRKKTVAIVASLSLGGIILLVVSSIVLLRSPEALARQFFPDGDYKIYLDSEMTEEKVMAAGNPLNEELKQEILSIDGVTDIIPSRQSLYATLKTDIYQSGGMCDMLTDQNYATVEAALTAGTMPKDSRSIVIDYNVLKQNEDMGVGSTVDFYFGEGQPPVSVTVSGLFDSNKTPSGHGKLALDGVLFFAPEALFHELHPEIASFDYSWSIVNDPKKTDYVGAELKNIVASHSNIALDEINTVIEYEEMTNSFAFGSMEILSWLVFLFGVINLINTTLSNQIARKQENSILRSIGLTQKQLCEMNICEGLCYALFATLATLIVGLPASIFACRKMSVGAFAGNVVPYQFPVLEMGLFILVLFGMELILSVWTIRRQKKQSLIEQMRAME